MPGLRTTETPIEMVFELSGSDETVVGAIGVAVDPGVEFCIDTDRVPWDVSVPEDPELELRAKVSRISGMQRAREAASDAKEDAGMIRGANGQRIMSVRVSDHCNRGMTQFERRPCGRSFCPLCDGFVDPVRRT